MHINSTRLGVIDVPKEHIYRFPDGMPGFPEERAFALLPYQPDSPFFFLQSVTEPNLTFILVEPFSFFPDYTFHLDDNIARAFGLSVDNKPQIFNIVTIRDKVEEMTANLIAPIILNQRTQLGMQYVLERSNYTTRHRLFPHGLGQQTGEGGK